jgi:hypothetical protein
MTGERCLPKAMRSGRSGLPLYFTMVMPSMRSSRRDRTFVEQGKFIFGAVPFGSEPGPCVCSPTSSLRSGTIGNPKTKERSAVFWSA